MGNSRHGDVVGDLYDAGGWWPKFGCLSRHPDFVNRPRMVDVFGYVAAECRRKNTDTVVLTFRRAARHIGCGVNTIRRALDLLAEKGFIKVEGRKHASPEITIIAGWDEIEEDAQRVRAESQLKRVAVTDRSQRTDVSTVDTAVDTSPVSTMDTSTPRNASTVDTHDRGPKKEHKSEKSDRVLDRPPVGGAPPLRSGASIPRPGSDSGDDVREQFPAETQLKRACSTRILGRSASADRGARSDSGSETDPSDEAVGFGRGDTRPGKVDLLIDAYARHFLAADTPYRPAVSSPDYGHFVRAAEHMTQFMTTRRMVDDDLNREIVIRTLVLTLKGFDDGRIYPGHFGSSRIWETGVPQTYKRALEDENDDEF